jgi:hypothetical protein
MKQVNRLNGIRILIVTGLGGFLVVLSLGAPIQSFGEQNVDTGSSSCPVLQVDSPGPGDFCRAATI